MNRSVACVGSGLILGMAYLLMGTGRRVLWPLQPLLIFCLCFLNGMRMEELLRPLAGLAKGLARTALLSLVVYSAVFVLRSLVEERRLPDFDLYPQKGPDILLKNVTLAAALVIIFIRSKTLTTVGAFWALVVGIGFNAGANLVLDKLVVGEENIFGGSRFAAIDFRWAPQFVRSNALFAMACTAGTMLALNILVRSGMRPKKRLLVYCAILTAIICCSYASVKCQFRAHLLCFAVGCCLMVVRNRRLVMGACVIALISMVLFPLSFAGSLGNNLLDALALDRILVRIGSSTEGTSDLSLRTQIYTYGWSRAADPRIFLAGEGPVLRDAQAGIGQIGLESYRMAYHGAILDLLMQNGIVSPVWFLACVVALLYKANSDWSRASPDQAGSDGIQLALINMTLWLSLSVMDSGLTSFENLWFALCPLLGAVSEKAAVSSDRKQHEPSGGELPASVPASQAEAT